MRFRLAYIYATMDWQIEMILEDLLIQPQLGKNPPSKGARGSASSVLAQAVTNHVYSFEPLFFRVHTIVVHAKLRERGAGWRHRRPVLSHTRHDVSCGVSCLVMISLGLACHVGQALASGLNMKLLG